MGKKFFNGHGVFLFYCFKTQFTSLKTVCSQTTQLCVMLLRFMTLKRLISERLSCCPVFFEKLKSFRLPMSQIFQLRNSLSTRNPRKYNENVEKFKGILSNIDSISNMHTRWLPLFSELVQNQKFLKRYYFKELLHCFLYSFSGKSYKISSKKSRFLAKLPPAKRAITKFGLILSMIICYLWNWRYGASADSSIFSISGLSAEVFP